MKRVISGISAIAVSSLMILSPVSSIAKTYTVDLDENYTWVCDTLGTEKWMETDSFPAGTYTIKLKSSTSTHFGWRDLVVLNHVGGISGTCSDYSWMTLNGVGDSITLTFDTWGKIRAGVIDGYPGDNGGDIEIEVRGSGSIGTYPDSVIATVSVGDNPAGIAVTPGGSYVYVTNIASDNVSVIRTSDYTVVDTVSVRDAPVGIAITPDGNYAYVICYSGSSDNVFVIRTSDNTVVDTVSAGADPQQVVVTPNGDYVYVSNVTDDNVSVIRTSDNIVVDTIPVGNSPNHLNITPDGNYVYVPNGHGSSVSVIQTSDNTVVATVPVGNEPTALSSTPNGNYVYVAHWRDDVYVIRTSDNTVVDTIPIDGDRSHAVVFTPDGKYAYVTSNDNDNVYVIRTSDNTIIDTISVGDGPTKALTCDNNYVYVANEYSDDVSVIGLRGIAKTYTVDLDVNYTWKCDTLGFEKWMRTDTCDSGPVTIKVKSSTSTHFGWRDLVILNPCEGLSGTCTDYALVTLNGVGDSVTLTFDRKGAIMAGVLDGYPWDNGGDITIEVRCNNATEEENTESSSLKIESILNPVSSDMDIHFSLPKRGMFSLCLYDLTGRELKTIDSGIKRAGKHQTRFKAEEFASGIYFLRLETEFGTAIKKIVMMK